SPRADFRSDASLRPWSRSAAICDPSCARAFCASLLTRASIFRALVSRSSLTRSCLTVLRSPSSCFSAGFFFFAVVLRFTGFFLVGIAGLRCNAIRLHFQLSRFAKKINVLSTPSCRPSCDADAGACCYDAFPMATLPKPGASSERLKPGLSLFDSVTLVAGSMIGSGIFIVSADITRQVATPAALLLVWLVAGVMTIAGALAYGELAAMMPQAGGQYVYLREAYGGMWAFMFGWTLLLVIQTGTIAAVAVAFARFAGVMWPVLGSNLWIGADGAGLSGERAGAIVVIAVLTAANLRGLNMGKWLQNSLTTAKILSLCLIVVVGCLIVPNPVAIRANFGSSTAFLGAGSMSIAGAGVFGAAMVGALFSADAWASVTFAAAEVRNPKRDLPLALAFGTGVVIALYILTNVAYLCELPATGTADAASVVGRGIAHAS